MRKQVMLFFVIMVVFITLIQLLFATDQLTWQVLLQSILAGALSSLLFWLMVRAKNKR